MIPWTVARQSPVSMGFPRQEYWRGLPFPSPGNLPDPGIKFRSSALQADSLPTEPSGKYYSAVKKERALSFFYTCYNMDEPEGHYTE